MWVVKLNYFEHILNLNYDFFATVGMSHSTKRTVLSECFTLHNIIMIVREAAKKIIFLAARPLRPLTPPPPA